MFNLELNNQKVRVYFNRKAKDTVCTIVTPEVKYTAKVTLYYKDMFNKHRGMLEAMQKTLKQTDYTLPQRRMFYEKFFSIVPTKKLR